MSNLIHVLGSDIPHHNVTMLRFFNDTLVAIYLPTLTRSFMVVSQNSMLFSVCDQLDIEYLDSKKALTKALVRRAAAAPDEQYFFAWPI